MHNSLRLRRIVYAGMFAAMGIVLKIFAITTGEFRASFFDLPLFLGGIVLGPIDGLIIGFVVDWLYVMIHPLAFSFNLMTVSTMLWGFMGGLIFFQKRHLSTPLLTATIVVTSIVAFSLNSLQLYIWLGPGMLAQVPLRLLTMVIKWPIQVFAIKLLHERVIVSFALQTMRAFH